METTRDPRAKEWFVFMLSMILLTDLAILLNIPFLRQILGFLFLTLLPGLLILQILKLNKTGSTEKFVLSVGLSISFLMFFGLLINNSLFNLGYETPLATIPLLILFNLVFVVLAIIGYKTNKDPIFSLPNINLTTSEKAFLIVPIIFPALIVFGMHIMNATNNNIILIFLLFLIPTYVTFVCFFNQKFPKRLYPVVIFLISISLLLLLPLRSNHIIGIDVHSEYYLFQTTIDNLHWRVFVMGNALDACLSISLLPTIYQSFLNIGPEFLFKILYSLIYSISPLAIYVLSKKYVEEGYAFLASCVFMFHLNFLFTEYNARTNIAILFFALAMMTLFCDKIDPLKKRILFIVFMASCMISHYSTTYIFFFVMVGTFIGIEILSKKYTLKKVVSLTTVILFFSMIFFWYSQVTETAFTAGVVFVEDTLSNLNMFFIEESRGGGMQELFGRGIIEKGIPHKIEFVFTWLMFTIIGIGVLTMIKKYKEMSFPELNFRKAEFLKDKFEVGYFLIALMCSGLLVAMVALPYLSLGYNLDRLYGLAITILSVFFVIGGITLSEQTFKKHFFFFKKRKPVLKEKSNCFFGKAFFSKERLEGKNGLQVRAYLVILLVLIPYFFCVTGVMYNIFSVPHTIILDSEGELYDRLYVHDQESCGAKWLKEYSENKMRVYTDFYGRYGLISQASFSPDLIDRHSLIDHKKIKGYLYLRYYNVVNDKLTGRSNGTFYNYNLTEYDDVFLEKDKIYNNGGAEVYR